MLRSKKTRRGNQISGSNTPRTDSIKADVDQPDTSMRESDDENPENGQPVEPSKRAERRAKEARKKAEEEAKQNVAKEARKSAKKKLTSGDSLAQQDDKLDKGEDPGRSLSLAQQNGKLGKFHPPERKQVKKGGKGNVPPEDEFPLEKIAKAVGSVREKREKMQEKWADHWSGQRSTTDPP